jgi:peptide/nickel transport system substrate-binding protein
VLLATLAAPARSRIGHSKKEEEPMKTKRETLGLRASLLLAFLAVLFVACGPQAAPTTAPQATAAGAPQPQVTQAATIAPQPQVTQAATIAAQPQPTSAGPSAKKVVVIGLQELVTSFDYPYDWAIVATWIQSNIGDCLVWRDRNTTAFVPWLAESFQNVNDTTWRFKLRPNIKFTNGEPFNSQAVKYTVERIQADQKALVWAQWTFIKQVNIVDDLNLEIVTNNPEPAFLSKMAGTACQVVPPKYAQQVGSQGFGQSPIGTGPFKFVEWKKDDRIVLEANPEYFKGKPAIDQIVFRAIPESSTRVAEALTAGVDLAVSPPSQDWPRIQSNQNLVLDKFQTTQTMMLVARAGPSKTLPDFKGVTTNPKIRQAIELAIDRKALVDLISGMGVPTLTRITPPTLGVNPKLYNTVGEYNVAKAKQLVQDAGYKGETLTFHSTTAWLMQKEVSEAITAMLTNIGLKVDLKLLPITSFREQVYAPNKNEELYLDALGNSFFDPWITVLSEQSDRRERSGWSGPEADEADKLIRAAAVNMNADERGKQYQRIAELMDASNGGAYMFLYQAKDAVARNKRFNFQVPLDGFLWLGQANVTQ